jgi:hypothetical protein
MMLLLADVRLYALVVKVVLDGDRDPRRHARTKLTGSIIGFLHDGHCHKAHRREGMSLDEC